MKNQITLVIELAIGHGSMSLWRGTEMIDVVRPGGTAKRSEDVLDRIDKLLRDSGRTIKDVHKIVCSRGPGGYTGIRVGMATALGLRRSAGIDVVGYTTIGALLSLGDSDRNSAALIDAGRNEYLFATQANSVAVRIVKKSELGDLLRHQRVDELISAVSVPPELEEADNGQLVHINASDNVTQAMLVLSIDDPERGTDLTPVYGREFGGAKNKR